MSTKLRHSFYESPLARLYLTVCDEQIVSLEYEPEDIGRFQHSLTDGEIRNWLDDYFAGHQPQNTPAIRMQGTAFQKKVWESMLRIPYGETLSYGDVSNALGSSPRAVGQACKRNRIPIVIPCHRIVARHSIGGYEGATDGLRISRKQWLLTHEQSIC